MTVRQLIPFYLALAIAGFSVGSCTGKLFWNAYKAEMEKVNE